MIKEVLHSQIKVSKQLEHLYFEAAQKIADASAEHISNLLIELKKRSPGNYVDLVVEHYHALMYSPNPNVSEKREEPMSHVDDFISEHPNAVNNTGDYWAGFNSSNEPYRKIEDL